MISLRKKDNKNQEKQVDLSVEKLALSNTISIEALIETLAKKGLIKREDVLEEVKRIGQRTKVTSDSNKK